MIKTCPICKVHSLKDEICECCGYIANRNGINVIPAFTPNQYSANMRYRKEKVTCNCERGSVCENQK